MTAETSDKDQAGTDARNVRNMFARIAGVYDPLNRIFSLGLDSLWRKRLSASARPLPPSSQGRILDLAAGTMDVSMGLARRYPHHTILAMDFCFPMLRQGLPKLRRIPAGRILPLVGDGRKIPLPDASVDAVTIAFGLRNIRPRDAVYQEVLRVLVPGGRFCVLEFGSAKDRILFGLYNLYLSHVLPLAGWLVSRHKSAYRYLAETVISYPPAAVLAEEMRQAGFNAVAYTPHTAGIVCLHRGEKPL